jgi:hypothetical protein
VKRGNGSHEVDLRVSEVMIHEVGVHELDAIELLGGDACPIEAVGERR